MSEMPDVEIKEIKPNTPKIKGKSSGGISESWNKLSGRQKGIVIAVGGGVILGVLFLINSSNNGSGYSANGEPVFNGEGSVNEETSNDNGIGDALSDLQDTLNDGLQSIIDNQGIIDDNNAAYQKALYDLLGGMNSGMYTPYDSGSGFISGGSYGDYGSSALVIPDNTNSETEVLQTNPKEGIAGIGSSNVSKIEQDFEEDSLQDALIAYRAGERAEISGKVSNSIIARENGKVSNPITARENGKVSNPIKEDRNVGYTGQFQRDSEYAGNRGFDRQRSGERGVTVTSSTNRTPLSVTESQNVIRRAGNFIMGRNLTPTRTPTPNNPARQTGNITTPTPVRVPNPIRNNPTAPTKTPTPKVSGKK